MTVILIILSLIFLGVIIYFAVSPKSSRMLRLASIIALALICISLVICVIIIVIGPKEEADDILLPFIQDSGQQADQSRAIDIIIFIGLLLVLGLVIMKAVRDERKNAASSPKKSRAGLQADKQGLDHHELEDLEHREPMKTDTNDDDFDIEIK